MAEILIPISVVVVLPVLIVWIVCRTVANRDNKNAEIVIKAIESNSSVNADRLVKALARRVKNPRQTLQLRLLRGCLFTFVGLALAIFTIVMAYCAPYMYMHYPTFLLSVIMLAIGLAYLVVYFVTRKNIEDDVDSCK